MKNKAFVLKYENGGYIKTENGVVRETDYVKADKYHSLSEALKNIEQIRDEDGRKIVIIELEIEIKGQIDPDMIVDL
jgi:agmatine/peptidylarginine deiminase